MATTWSSTTTAHNRGATGQVSVAGTMKYGSLDETESVKIQRKFLAIAKRNLVFARFAQKETKERNAGLEVRWKRFEKMALPLVPLAEGIKPPADTLTQTLIKVKLNQFGSYVATTDVLVAAAEDPIIQQIVERQSIQAAELMDYVTYLHMRTGTLATYATGQSTLARNEVSFNIGMNIGAQAAADGNKIYKTDLLDQAIRTLEGNEARKIVKQMTPSADYGTVPVPEAYVAVCHTDLRKDIELMPGFIPYQKYANNGMQMLPGEVGAVGSIRFILTTQASAFGEDPDGTARFDTDISATQGTYSPGWTTAVFGQTVTQSSAATNATFGRPGAAQASDCGFDADGTVALANSGHILDAATSDDIKLNTITDSTGAVRVKVYPVMIFAEDGIGCVSLSGFDSVIPKVVMPQPAVTDPLGQSGSVGWKTWYACRILNEEWVYRIECGASSLS